MDDIDGVLADGARSGKEDGFPLMERTNRERWEIPASLRCQRALVRAAGPDRE